MVKNRIEQIRSRCRAAIENPQSPKLYISSCHDTSVFILRKALTRRVIEWPSYDYGDFKKLFNLFVWEWNTIYQSEEARSLAIGKCLGKKKNKKQKTFLREEEKKKDLPLISATISSFFSSFTTSGTHYSFTWGLLISNKEKGVSKRV